MKTFVGFPDWLKNRDSVDRYYPGLLNLIYPDSHFFNYIQLSRWHVNRNLIRAFLAKDLTEYAGALYFMTRVYSFQDPFQFTLNQVDCGTSRSQRLLFL